MVYLLINLGHPTGDLAKCRLFIATYIIKKFTYINLINKLSYTTKNIFYSIAFINNF